MPEPEVHRSASKGTTLERDRNDVLGAARPLPPDAGSLSMISPRMRIVSSWLPSSKHEPRLPRPGCDRQWGLRRPSDTQREITGVALPARPRRSASE